MHKIKPSLLAVTVLTLVARMAFPVFAQEATGSIRGTVSDEQGAVIQNATVTATKKATGDTRKVTTGSDGNYLVSTLVPGDYEVKIEAQGFSTQTRTMTVLVGATINGNVSLRVGSSSEVVNVVAEAPQIDKQNFKIDGVITRQKIDALPLNGRNFLQLALLEPGVGVTAVNPGFANVLFNVSIGGGPAALTRLTVDGGSISDPVTGGSAQNFSTETIQEFQISTFNFDLSTGVTSVGAINIVSRTGTNDFHGNAFIYVRDAQLAAVPTLQQSNTDFRRYQYGGAFGGPIKKDRAFFFGNLERLDQNAAIGIVNTGFAGFNQFNTTFASPYKGWLLNVRGDVKINDRNNMFTRFSYDRNRSFSPEGQNEMPSRWLNNSNRDPNLQYGITTIFRQNIVNDARFNYQRITNINGTATAAECPPSNPACIGLGGPEVHIVGGGSNIVFGNNAATPQQRFLDRYQTSDNVNWVKGSHRIRFGGEWEHNYGHGLFEFASPAVLFLYDPAVVLFVDSLVNQFLPPSYNIPLPSTFLSGRPTAADFLQLPIAFGVLGFGNRDQPQPFHNSIARQSNRYRLYAQDSWQIRPGFTLSFGASYMYETNLQNHDLPKPGLVKSLVGDIGKPGKDMNNIAPSLGFAWDIGNKGKTVLRGGAGIYYDTVLFFNRLGERALVGPAGVLEGRILIPSPFFQNNIPFTRIPGIPEPFASINPAIGTSINFQVIPTKFTGQNFLDLLNAPPPSVGLALIGGVLNAAGKAGFTGIDVFKATPPAAALSLLDPNLQTPYSQQISFGLQRQLPGNMSLSADFVLRQRRHTLILEDYNLFNRVAARGGPKIRQCVGAEAVTPTAQCSNGAIAVLQSSGREEYRALLVKLDKRFSHKFQFTASYALSSLTGFFVNEDQTAWFKFHGPIGDDRRHRLTISGVAELPWNMQASLIAVYASRAPFNARLGDAITGVDVTGDGTRGDTLPGLKINSLGRETSKEQLFQLANKAGVTLPSKFEFGDDLWSQDVRVTKTFKIKERYSIQAFVEVFNILNIANLTDFGQDITGPSAGQPSTSFGQPRARVGQAFGIGGPRAFQLGGRFSF